MNRNNLLNCLTDILKEYEKIGEYEQEIERNNDTLDTSTQNRGIKKSTLIKILTILLFIIPMHPNSPDFSVCLLLYLVGIFIIFIYHRLKGIAQENHIQEKNLKITARNSELEKLIAFSKRKINILGRQENLQQRYYNSGDLIYYIYEAITKYGYTELEGSNGAYAYANNCLHNKIQSEIVTRQTSERLARQDALNERLHNLNRQLNETNQTLRDIAQKNDEIATNSRRANQQNGADWVRYF